MLERTPETDEGLWARVRGGRGPDSRGTLSQCWSTATGSQTGAKQAGTLYPETASLRDRRLVCTTVRPKVPIRQWRAAGRRLASDRDIRARVRDFRFHGHLILLSRRAVLVFDCNVLSGGEIGLQSARLQASS